MIKALKYMKLEITDPKDVSRHSEVSERLQAWKSTMQRERNTKDAQQLAEDVEESYSYDHLTRILRHQPMPDFYNHLTLTGVSSHLSPTDLRFATAVMTATLLYKSAQRPGAVMSATIQYYCQAAQNGSHVWPSQTDHGGSRLC